LVTPEATLSIPESCTQPVANHRLLALLATCSRFEAEGDFYSPHRRAAIPQYSPEQAAIWAYRRQSTLTGSDAARVEQGLVKGMIDLINMTTIVMRNRVMRKIQLKDAKARLSAVVDDAVRGQAAVITRHGKPEAVVLSFREWERLAKVPTFGQLLMSAPIKAADLPRRNRSPLRRASV
jgi:antitoxin Phd